MTTHAFSPTCHSCSPPIVSSAGRPKNALNHSSALVWSLTGRTLYKSTRTTPLSPQPFRKVDHSRDQNSSEVGRPALRKRGGGCHIVSPCTREHPPRRCAC